MARIDTFLRMVVDQRASDLHLCAGSPPTIRYNGDLIFLRFRVLDELEVRRLMMEILTEEQRTDLRAEFDLDFAYEVEGLGRFRVNVYHQTRGMAAAFRVIPDKVPSFADLNLPNTLRQFTRLDNGLVLITGPTGSGKSTTLAAMIEEINANQRKHIITIEDPIEYVYEEKLSLLSQREVGTHCASFAAALKASYRESPDVILVGELRDNETISMAITMAATGSLVLGTLHTASVAHTVDRIIDAYPDEQQDQIRGMLAMSLRGAVAQQLCKTADGRGRIPALEILLPSYALATLIRERKTFRINSLIQLADYKTTGMETMDQCLMRYVNQGLISREEARFRANDKSQFESLGGQPTALTSLTTRLK